MTIENTSENKNPIIRPERLNILCILTFVGSGISALSSLIMYFSIDGIQVLFENGAFDFVDDNASLEALELLIGVNSTFFILNALIFALSFYGALLMFNLRKFGFHLYTISQILLVIISQVYLPNLPFPFFKVMISLIFIALYSKYLKIMK